MATDQHKTSDESTGERQQTVGKGRPTPTRKEAQARKERPLIGDRSKEAKRRAREEYARARDRARIGMAQGDERYLTVRDKGPQRRFIRNWVDARWNIGELLIPVMLVVLILTLLPRNIAVYSMIFLWTFVGLVVLDSIFMTLRLKKALERKFGAENVNRFRWYAISRAAQLRILRLPKPQVKRGDYPS